MSAQIISHEDFLAAKRAKESKKRVEAYNSTIMWAKKSDWSEQVWAHADLTDDAFSS